MPGKWRYLWMLLCALVPLSSFSVRAEEAQISNEVGTREANVFILGDVSADKVKPGDMLSYQIGLDCNSIAPLFDENEEGEELSHIDVVWSSQSGKQKIRQTFMWTSDEGGRRAYKREIPIRQGMEKGTWKISKISFQTDVSGDENWADWIWKKPYAGRAVVYNSAFPQEVADDEKKAGSKILYEDLSFGNFTVSGTGKALYDAPKIKLNSLSMTQKRTKKGMKISFRIKTKDKRPMKYVILEMQYRTTARKNGFESWEPIFMKYNKKRNCYEAMFYCKGKKQKKWYHTLWNIRICDLYDHKVTYSRKKYKSYFKKITVPQYGDIYNGIGGNMPDYDWTFCK